MKGIIYPLLLISLRIVHPVQAQNKDVDKSKSSLSNPDKPRDILKEVSEGKAYLIDVRSLEEYKERHLKYSANFDVRSSDFKKKISLLDKGKKVYVYCRSGKRSELATDSLRSLGFFFSYNLGGFDSLLKAGFPIDN